MFCNQCEQAASGVGCKKVAVCGKPENVANLFDLLRWQIKGISWLAHKARSQDKTDAEIDQFIIQKKGSNLFLTLISYYQ
jgi:hydroxylamine reductase